MPGTRCAVAVCNNSRVETKKKNLDITYHTFPKHEQVFEEWVKACCRKDKWNPKTSVVCSEHFKEDDYMTDLMAKLLNLKVKPKLKPSAIPSVFLTASKCGKHVVRSKLRKKSVKKRSQKKVMPEINLGFGDESKTEPELVTVETLDEDIQFNVASEYGLQELVLEHESLKISHKALQDSFDEQKRELEGTHKLLTNVAAKLENETRRRQQLEETLTKVLNKSQQVVMVVKK